MVNNDLMGAQHRGLLPHDSMTVHRRGNMVRRSSTTSTRTDTDKTTTTMGTVRNMVGSTKTIMRDGLHPRKTSTVQRRAVDERCQGVMEHRFLVPRLPTLTEGVPIRPETVWDPVLGEVHPTDLVGEVLL